jgi:hypothetical protein
MYSATPKGRRSLDTWMQRSPRPPHGFRDDMLVRLLDLNLNNVACALQQLGLQQRVYEEYVEHLRARSGAGDARSDGPTMLRALAVEGALFRAQAHLRWLQHSATMLQRWANPTSDKSERRTHGKNLDGQGQLLGSAARATARRPR